MTVINETTPHLGLQLPHPSNSLEDDVGRLRSALGGIDTRFGTLDSELDTAFDTINASLTAIGTLLASNDPAYDTLQEIVTALKANIALLTSHIGSNGTSAHTVATTLNAGFMSVADKSKLGGVILGDLFDTVAITPSSNGQTAFTVTGGYVPGRIWVFLNGLKMVAADFTATTSPNLVLAVGAQTTDDIEVIRFKQALAA